MSTKATKPKRLTPTRAELREVRRIQRLREELKAEENDALRELAAKYVPCKKGDFIEIRRGGEVVNRGMVLGVSGDVHSEKEYHFHVQYRPWRKRGGFTKTNLNVTDMSVIHVVPQPA